MGIAWRPGLSLLEGFGVTRNLFQNMPASEQLERRFQRFCRVQVQCFQKGTDFLNKDSSQSTPVASPPRAMQVQTGEQKRGYD